MVALWRQRLSVAVQQEGFRILRAKVAAALGGLVSWRQWGEEEGCVEEVTWEDVDGVPGLPRGSRVAGAPEE